MAFKIGKSWIDKAPPLRVGWQSTRIEASMANKNILLIEPGYRNKYPPLGLMKIAQYHGPEGKRDNVRFVKGEDPSVYENGMGSCVYYDSLFF